MVAILIVVGAIGTFGFNFQIILPLVTKYVLVAGASTLALLTTSSGVGAVLAGLFAAYREKLRLRLLLGAATAFVLLLLFVGLSKTAVLTAILMFMIGFAGVLIMTTANTRLQLRVPGHMRSR